MATSDNGQEPLTAKQLARMLNTKARTVRKFLRTEYGNVGQGNRWTVGLEDELLEHWAAWRKPIEARLSKGGEAVIEESDEGDGEEVEL